jgi:hypothetical protein
MVEFNEIVFIEYLSHNGLSEFMSDIDYLNSCSITFRFDIPVFLSRLHLEDRSWGFCRFYLDKEPRFYVPKGFKAKDSEDNVYFWNNNKSRRGYHIRDDVYSHCEQSFNLFNQLIEEGIDESSAAMVLPQNQYIRYIASINLKNLRDYLRLPSRIILEKELKETLLQICRYRVINWREYEPL